jgi:hypothetical protein
MQTIILCFVVGAIMIVCAILQVQITVHFWSGFVGSDDTLKALIIGVATCMALLESCFLAVSAECRRRGLHKEAGRVMVMFWFTFLGNFAADYSAFVTLTAGDRDVRAQAAQVYQMDRARLDQLERDIAGLQARLAADDMNMPSVAIAAMLSGQQELAARYQANNVEVPQGMVRRMARLESARVTAERLEALEAERAAAADALRGRDAVPDAVHPQFASIAALTGNLLSPEQVRSILPVILVIAFKASVIWMFGVLAAIIAHLWGHRAFRQDEAYDGATSEGAIAGADVATPPPPCTPSASSVFAQNILKHGDIDHRLGQQLFQAAVFFVERL